MDNVKPKGLEELLEDDPSLTKKITYEEHMKRVERMKDMCGKTSEQKLQIAVNALRAISIRVLKSDDYINSTMSDCKKTADNALKMIGGN